MKTGLMEIALCNGLITADAKTGMIDLKSIEKVGNGLFGLTDENQAGYKRLTDWQKTDIFKDFIEVCERKSIGGKLPIEKVGKNRYAKTWGNLHVAIAFAMWLSPEFKYSVIDVFINKKILDFRLLGIDYNKQLNALLDNLEDRKGLENRQIFIDVAIKIKEAVFGEYHEGWDNEISDADALEKRSKIQNELIFLMKKSYIKNYTDLLNYFTKL